MRNIDQLEQPRHARFTTLALAATVGLLLFGVDTAAAKKPLKEIKVDCARGHSINKALDNDEAELIIHIRGICTEDVVVARDRVSLLGADPALDGIQAASSDDPFGSALFIRGSRRVNVENLQLTGGRHAGLSIEDARRNVILRNLRIEGNQEVGLLASNALVVGFDLSVMGNGLAGIGLSETAYLRCDDCRVAENPAADQGFGVIGSAGALATLFRGSISARFPLSMRFNSVADVRGTSLSGLVAVDASGNASITVSGADIDGSIRADEDSRIELKNAQQLFNPLGGGNIISGASQLTVSGGTTLIGETAFDEFSNGMFGGGAALETLACANGSDAICAPGVTMSSSSCAACS